MDKILDVKKLKSGYGNIQILNGIDLFVENNEFVTIIGPYVIIFQVMFFFKVIISLILGQIY